MGTPYFNIAALCILTLNLFVFHFRSKVFLRETRIFGLLLLASLIACILDTITVMWYESSDSIHGMAHYTVNVLYYIAQNVLPPIFLVFIFEVTRIRITRRIHRLLIFIPWLVGFILIVTTPWTHVVFFFTETMQYTRGPGLHAMYLIAAIYIFMCVGMMYRRKIHISRTTGRAVFIFLPFAIAPMISQYFFPTVLIQNLGIALAELLALFTIQDFGQYTDPHYKLYNRSGFLLQAEQMLAGGQPFSCFIVTVDSAGLVRHRMTLDTYDSLEHTLITGLAGTMNGIKFAAETGASKYVFVYGSRNNLDEERARILEFLQKPAISGKRHFQLPIHICELHIPEDTSDLRRIFQIQQQLVHAASHYPTHTILNITDFTLSDSGRSQQVALAIRNALMVNSFTVVFQPIVCAETGKIEALEALVRLKDRTLGNISPAEFIPIAEQNGTIHRIGAFVLTESCRFMKQLHDRAIQIPTIEINLSAAECIQSNLVDNINRIVKNFNITPEEICFEITETVASCSPTIMNKNLNKLVDAGYSLAIDDFGTGYSNISSLLHIPFNRVKFDRSLIMHSTGTPTIAQSLFRLAHLFNSLDIPVIAEGVETMEELSLLKEKKVHLIQGYLFSRPLSEKDIITYLQERSV